MPANTTPIFPLTPNTGVNNALLSTAMTNTKAFDGTEAAGTAMVLAFTAGVNGARVDKVVARLASTNGAAASGTTTATLLRVWLNSGSVNTTATNNQLLGEIAVGATTVTALGTTVLPVQTLSLDLSIPAGYRIYVGSTAAIGGTNCAVAVSVCGGDY